MTFVAGLLVSLVCLKILLGEDFGRVMGGLAVLGGVALLCYFVRTFGFEWVMATLVLAAGFILFIYLTNRLSERISNHFFGRISKK